MTWTEQFDSGLDFPAPVDVSVKYAICSTPRSGSHLLGQLLYGTGRMGCPLEYFNRGNIIRWQGRAADAGAEDFVRFLVAIRTTPNGCFGLKAHFPQLKTLARYISLNDFVTAYAHIHIVRRDLLGQAISFARAEQTGEWISRGSASGRTVVYDRRLIRRCLIEIARQNASWNCFFHAFGLRPLVVEYESLAADPPQVVRKVATFIGVDLPPEVPIPDPRTSRQRDAESESWRDRFMDEMRRESAWPGSLDVLQHMPAVVNEGGLHRWKRRVAMALRMQ
jgi:trehalose 2-sulfotransferase